MTVETSWIVRIGYYDNGTDYTTTDFTSRTLGLSVAQSTELATIGTSKARISLDNNDGELTPGAGGTYGATEWFKYALEINCQIDYDAGSTVTTQVFAGIIDGFDLQDDGIDSTVTISAVDVFQTASRQQVETYSNAFVGSVSAAIRDLADPSNPFNNTVMPNFGETANPTGNIGVDKKSPAAVTRLILLQALRLALALSAITWRTTSLRPA